MSPTADRQIFSTIPFIIGLPAHTATSAVPPRAPVVRPAAPHAADPRRFAR